jgi:hypothetical protein
VAEMTGEARVVALDRLRPGDIADCSGELLDVVFGWADFARLRRQVAAQCAAAGLTGTRLDDFVLAVHEIAAAATAVVAAVAAAEPGEPIGADSGRGLWLAATLADELSITSGPDSTIVSLYMRLD